jgi:IS4 transposase
VALLRSLFDEAIEEFDPSRNDLRGRLERFRDVLIVDATFVSLYRDAADVYLGLDDDQAGIKLHVIESLRTGLPTRLQTTAGRTHERSQLTPGPWMQEALILLDLGFYDFWLFDRIDANGGWFVSRMKADANFEIIEELRTWPGNSISLEGNQLQEVLGVLHRQEIDVRIELSFDRKRGSSNRVTRSFRLVGLLNEASDEYHCYLTNLDEAAYSPTDIAQLYRARWEVELLFKELKSRFRLDEIRKTDPYIIEALILVAAISLLLSRVIVDSLHDLERARRATSEVGGDTDADVSAAVPRRRVSMAIERHAHLIHLYLMVELGYDLPDLDELLLWAAREPNLHRPRLRQ